MPQESPLLGIDLDEEEKKKKSPLLDISLPTEEKVASPLLDIPIDEDEHPWKVTYKEKKEPGWTRQFMENLGATFEPLGHFVFNLPENLMELDREQRAQYQAMARGEEPPHTPTLDEASRLVKQTLGGIAALGEENVKTFLAGPLAPVLTQLMPEQFPITKAIGKEYIAEPAKELGRRTKEKWKAGEGIKEKALAAPSAAFGMVADWAKDNPLDFIFLMTMTPAIGRKFAQTGVGKAIGMAGEASKWEKFISPKMAQMLEKAGIKAGKLPLFRGTKTARELRLMEFPIVKEAEREAKMIKAAGKVDARKALNILDDKKLIDADKEFLGMYMRAKGEAGVPVTKLDIIPENREILRKIAKKIQTTTNPAEKRRLRDLMQKTANATTTSEYGERVYIARDLQQRWYNETKRLGIALEPTEAKTVGAILQTPQQYKLTKKQLNIIKNEKNILNSTINGLSKPQPRLNRTQMKVLQSHDDLAHIAKEFELMSSWRKDILYLDLKKMKGIAKGEILPKMKAAGKLELMKRFPGRAKYLDDLKGTIQKIDDKIFAHIHQAGTEAYQRRMYRVYLEDKKKYEYLTAEEISRKPKIKALYTKQRLSERELPRAVRKEELGEVTQPGYPTASAIAEMSDDVSVWNKYNKILRSAGKDAPFAGAADKPFKLETRRWYKGFQGKYLPQDVHDHLMDMQKVLSRSTEISRKMVSFWKAMKVPYNIATQIRNAVSNIILADIAGGVSPFRDVKFYDDAVNQMWKKSPEYEAFQKMGVAQTTFVDAELKLFRSNYLRAKGTPYEKLLETFKNVYGAPSKLYGKTEEYFKFVVYLKQRSLGKTPVQAAEIAKKALFDYTEVPPFVDWLRKSPFGAPFATFSWKAFPLTLEMGLKRPLRVLKWMALAPMVTDYTADRLKIGKKKLNQLKAFLPEWVEPHNSALIGVDKDNRYEFLETGWYMPWGNIFENPKWAEKIPGLKHLPTPFSPGQNPIYQLLTAVMKNEDAFTGKKIVEDWDSWKAYIAKMGSYLLQQAGPPLAGGYAYKTLKAGLTGEKDYRGREKYTFPEAVGRAVLGVKKTPIDIVEQQQFAARELQQRMRDMQNAIIKITRDYNLTPREKGEKIKKIQDEMKKLRMEHLSRLKGEE